MSERAGGRDRSSLIALRCSEPKRVASKKQHHNYRHRWLRFPHLREHVGISCEHAGISQVRSTDSWRCTLTTQRIKRNRQVRLIGPQFRPNVVLERRCWAQLRSKSDRICFLLIVLFECRHSTTSAPPNKASSAAYPARPPSCRHSTRHQFLAQHARPILTRWQHLSVCEKKNQKVGQLTSRLTVSPLRSLFPHQCDGP